MPYRRLEHSLLRGSLKLTHYILSRSAWGFHTAAGSNSSLNRMMSTAAAAAAMATTNAMTESTAISSSSSTSPGAASSTTPPPLVYSYGSGPYGSPYHTAPCGSEVSIAKKEVD